MTCPLQLNSLICMRPIRPLPLDGHYLGTCHQPLRGLALSLFLNSVTTSYQTTCTALWDYFNKGTHASINVSRLIVLFYTVRQGGPSVIIPKNSPNSQKLGAVVRSHFLFQI